MIIQSVIQTYVYNQTMGAVTEPVNGNWLQAYCEFLGVTEPVNASWLQALCIYFGITAPLYGSWTIALADYYGITQPENGTWWYALSQLAGGPPVVPIVADFTADNELPTEGEFVQFTDTSTENPTSWDWTFTGGTPLSSSLQNPIVQYNTAGTYTVSLTASKTGSTNTNTKVDFIDVSVPAASFIWNLNTNNWEAETRIWDTVTVAPIAEFTSDITIVPEGGQVQYQDLSTSQPSSWAWTFAGGTPATSTAQNPLITYNTVGQYDTSLEASNIIGSDTNTKLNYIDTTPAEVTLTFELTTEWSLYWYYAGIQLEQEVTPGVWQALEYEGNPTWNTGAILYKVQPFVSPGGIPVGYNAADIMTFRTGDQSGTTNPGPIYRDIICPLAFNYRVVGVQYVGQTTNYGRFNGYTVKNGATVILPAYDGEDIDYATGFVQQTFTL